MDLKQFIAKRKAKLPITKRKLAITDTDNNKDFTNLIQESKHRSAGHININNKP